VKRKKPKKVASPALLTLAETFHCDPVPARTDTTDDARREAEWRSNQYRREVLWPLHEMSDALVAKLWPELSPASWSFNDLHQLVPRMGVAGLEASLRLVGAHLSELDCLAQVESARAAPLMANAFAGRPAVQTVARAWLERFPETAVVGLVPMLLASERTATQRALDALLLVRRQRPAALSRGLAHYAPEVRDAVEAVLERGVELPARKPTLPDFAQPERLPRPSSTTEAGHALQGEALADLVKLLKVTPLGGATWVEDLRPLFTPASLCQLAHALVVGWLSAGAPPREKWALQSAALFPDDALATTLAELAAELAPRGLSARAQEMVEVLAAMQTRTSLKLVHDLSRKVRSKAFRARAELAFRTAAEKMGLTEDELAERLVPDFGLTPEGVLPGGPWVLRLAVDGLKPRFVDQAGEVLKKLPVVDDAELASQHADLKKSAPKLLKEIAERLERRMATGRHMPVEHFLEVYLMHGLARPVAAHLVWGLYDERGRLESTFAPGAAGPVNVAGQAAPLPEGRTVGVVHPLELSAADRAQWATRLGQQPFEQLARHSRAFEGVRELETAARAYVGRTVASGTLLGLEKSGWVRGPTEDGGCFSRVTRTTSGGVAELTFEPGVYLCDPTMHPTQTVVGLELRLAESTPRYVLSEIEHDLHHAFAERASTR
jgi:hypothetical protein